MHQPISDLVERITIKGYKSIKSLENLELHNLNVLIGANGAGKSNFIGFFAFVRKLIDQGLQMVVETDGGADALLHLGPKVTDRIIARISLGENEYGFVLVPTNDNRLIFAEETLAVSLPSAPSFSKSFRAGERESLLKSAKVGPKSHPMHFENTIAYDSLSTWIAYHFDYSGEFSGVRRPGAINDNEQLRWHGSNLAALLYRLWTTDPGIYAKIRDVVRLAAPFFDDFKLRPVPTNDEFIQLEWTQLGSDYPFRPSQLSDGTLRFICLATALLQPSPPRTMLFDEPELGLHPYAITLLGNLFKQAAQRGQIIISTQSAQLLNEFDPEDVIVVDRAKGESIFRRLETGVLNDWLQEYGLGDLWQKNIFGGRPRDESTPVMSPDIPSSNTEGGGK